MPDQLVAGDPDRTGTVGNVDDADRGGAHSRSLRVRIRRSRVARAAAVAALLVVGYFGVTFAQVWQATTWNDEDTVDAIVVMGAAQYDGRPSPVLAGRLDRAVELYDADVAKLIVVTGGRQRGDRTTEAKSSYDYLRARGVPDRHLQLEVDGTNTWESLTAASRFLRRDGRTDVVVVSDPYHSYRVRDVAARTGLDAGVATTGVPASARSLIRETLAVAVGRLIGYHRL